MLHHVSVGVVDVERAAKFYDAVLRTLGYSRVMDFLPYAVAYGEAAPRFGVQLPHNRQTPSAGNGSHVSFVARSTDAVDAFFRTALENGAIDNGPPGPRPDYGPDYYGAFVIDPDGNRIEATLEPAPVRKRPAARPAAKRKPVRAAKTRGKSSPRKPARKARRPAKRARAKKR